jgi:hypothetical protein
MTGSTTIAKQLGKAIFRFNLPQREDTLFGFPLRVVESKSGLYADVLIPESETVIIVALSEWNLVYTFPSSPKRDMVERAYPKVIDAGQGALESKKGEVVWDYRSKEKTRGIVGLGRRVAFYPYDNGMSRRYHSMMREVAPYIGDSPQRLALEIAKTYGIPERHELSRELLYCCTRQVHSLGKYGVLDMWEEVYQRFLSPLTRRLIDGVGLDKLGV